MTKSDKKIRLTLPEEKGWRTKKVMRRIVLYARAA